MTLNMNGLNDLIKGRDCQTGFKKRRSNYMMTPGDILRFKYTKKTESKKIEEGILCEQ